LILLFFRCGLDVLCDGDDLHAVQLANSLYHPLLRHQVEANALTPNEVQHCLQDAYQQACHQSSSSSIRRAIGLGTVVTLVTVATFTDIVQMPRSMLSTLPAQLSGSDGGSRQNREVARLWAQLADSFRQNQLILARVCLQFESRAVDEATAGRLLDFAAESLGTVRYGIYYRYILCY
jgi:hypothetical protein